MRTLFPCDDALLYMSQPRICAQYVNDGAPYPSVITLYTAPIPPPFYYKATLIVTFARCNPYGNMKLCFA
jgi:hypothetical protein